MRTKTEENLELLADIVTARAAGNFNAAAGNADEDLLFALEEARGDIDKVIEELKAT